MTSRSPRPSPLSSLPSHAAAITTIDVSAAASATSKTTINRNTSSASTMDAAAASAVDREITAFLDAFERASVSEFAWVSTSSSDASTVSASTSSLAEDATAAAADSSDVATEAAAAENKSPHTHRTDRLSVASMNLTAPRDVNALLLALERALQQLDTFRGEEDRTKWWWLVHQLKQQQRQSDEVSSTSATQSSPSLRWDATADAALMRLEFAIAHMPTASSTSWRASASASNSSFITPDELRLSIVTDVPMLDDRPSSPPSPPPTSWSTTLSRRVRAASGRTVRALLGPADRDNDAASSNRSISRSNRSLSSSRSASHTDASVSDRTSRQHRESSRSDSIPTLQHRLSSASSLSTSNSNSSFVVPQLLRSVASALGLSIEETFRCQICLENVSLHRAVTLTACGHQFCAACLTSFLTFKISEANVYPTCFHETAASESNAPGGGSQTSACGAAIDPIDIEAAVDAPTFAKYNKFKFNKEHANARQCPHCDHSSLFRGSEAPACVCPKCHGEFCFVHSTAHRGRTCAAYEQKIVAIEKLNHAMINEISKPCPGCNNFVEKIGGCNQMKCVVCATSFCWICCAIIDDSVFPEHFQWWNVRGCAGNQMSEATDQTTAQSLWHQLVRGLFLVVFGPPAFVLAVVFSVLCCCCAPCTKIFETTYRNAFTTCLCASGYLLLAPLALAAALVCSPCLCCLYCYSPDEFADSVATVTGDDDPNDRDDPDVNVQSTAIEMVPDNDDAIIRVSV